MNTYKDQVKETERFLHRTMKSLLTYSPTLAPSGFPVRRAVGDLFAFYLQYVTTNTLSSAIMKCFSEATLLGVSLSNYDQLLAQLIKEEPSPGLPTIVTQICILFVLAQEVRVLTETTFVSRDDVEIVQARMKNWFALAKELAADELDSASYQAVIDMAAACTRYLVDTARPLSRMVNYEINAVMPALALANYIYGDGSRSDEIVNENKVVHPAFCPISFRALSA